MVKLFTVFVVGGFGVVFALLLVCFVCIMWFVVINSLWGFGLRLFCLGFGCRVYVFCSCVCGIVSLRCY